jgi:hypothetical protein
VHGRSTALNGDKEEDPPALFIIDSLGSLIMVRGG